MYFYLVGYSSYEEAPTYTLMCNKEYTQSEFDILLSDCIVEAYFLCTSDKSKFEEIEAVAGLEEYDYHSRLENLIGPAIEILVSKHDFIEPQFKCSFQPFGWASIKNEDDWKGEKDKQLDLVRERFKIIVRDRQIDGISKK